MAHIPFGSVVACAVSPEANWLCLSKGSSVMLHDVTRDRLVWEDTLSTERVVSLAFSPAEEFVAMGDTGGSIRVLCTRTGEHVGSFTLDVAPKYLQWMKDSRDILTVDSLGALHRLGLVLA